MMMDVDLQKRIDIFLKSALQKFIVRDYDNAVRELKAAEMLDRDNPEILYNLGITYCRMGLDKTAAGYFKKILNLTHTFIDALAVKKLLSFSLIQIKKYKESERYLDEVMELVPLDVAALSMKGYCLEIQNRPDEALRVYRSILEADTHNNNACNSIAYITAKTGGDLTASLSYARMAYESNKENSAYLDTLGFVLMKMGKLDQAEHYLTLAIQRAPLSEEINAHIQELDKIKSRQDK
jgi:tetratricopeptide (TPR) repeat protein